MVSRAFLGSAAMIMNFRPVDDVDGCDETFPGLGVFGLLVDELKLSSLTPCFGKLGLS